jgi:hypothetical protein
MVAVRIVITARIEKKELALFENIILFSLSLFEAFLRKRSKLPLPDAPSVSDRDRSRPCSIIAFRPRLAAAGKRLAKCIFWGST